MAVAEFLTVVENGDGVDENDCCRGCCCLSNSGRPENEDEVTGARISSAAELPVMIKIFLLLSF